MTRRLAPALAAVWLVHGVYNKLLGGSPRHLAIVQSIPGLSLIHISEPTRPY